MFNALYHLLGLVFHRRYLKSTAECSLWPGFGHWGWRWPTISGSGGYKTSAREMWRSCIYFDQSRWQNDIPRKKSPQHSQRALQPVHGGVLRRVRTGIKGTVRQQENAATCTVRGHTESHRNAKCPGRSCWGEAVVYGVFMHSMMSLVAELQPSIDFITCK